MTRAALLFLLACPAAGARACETCRPLVAEGVYGPRAGLGGGFLPTLATLALPLVAAVLLAAVLLAAALGNALEGRDVPRC